MRPTLRTRAIALISFLLGCCNYSQTSSSQQTMNIWPGVAPGSENWTQKETVENTASMGKVIVDVVTPTLTVFLPDRTKFPEPQANRTGIIIAPGGACVALAIDHEGNNVARWLQEKGITAFVLKYRTMEKKGEDLPPDLNEDVACKYGLADGLQAIRVVRQHAAKWGLRQP